MGVADHRRRELLHVVAEGHDLVDYIDIGILRLEAPLDFGEILAMLLVGRRAPPVPYAQRDGPLLFVGQQVVDQSARQAGTQQYDR